MQVIIAVTLPASDQQHVPTRLANQGRESRGEHGLFHVKHLSSSSHSGGFEALDASAGKGGHCGEYLALGDEGAETSSTS